MSEYIQTIEVEHPDYNGKGTCNNCQKTIYWNKGVINRNTKRLMPLESEYHPSSGVSPKRHLCMQKGDRWINKYEKLAAGLKKTWCEFCNNWYDLSHFSILVNPTKRPYLMCNMEVKTCNFADNYEPLVNGWFRPNEKKQ